MKTNCDFQFSISVLRSLPKGVLNVDFVSDVSLEER